MSGFMALLGKELREQVRTYRLPVVAIVFLLFGIISPVLARYTKQLLDALGSQATGGIQIVVPAPTVADAVDQLLKNLGQFGILIAILLAMGTVAAEKERGTAALILTKPASRLAFLLAKLVAVGLTLAVAVAVGCAIGYLYIQLLFADAGLSAGGYVEMAILLWLAIYAYAALTFLGSTVTRSAAGGAGIGFVALIATGIIGGLPTVGPYMPLALTGPAARLAVGASVATDLAGPVAAAILFIAVPFALAWWSFRRQEL
jgi:ABC-2 type transport system permease protein